jgi:hypothetical protein
MRKTFLESLKPVQSSDTLDERGAVATHSQDHDGYRYVGTYRDHYADGTSSTVTLHKILR